MTAPRPLTVSVSPFESRRPDAQVLDLDRLVESRLLIQANSGGGKSRAIRYLLEQTHGHIQHIVIDREGEFATLRGKFPYLLVGPGGEIAADTRGAKLLARKLLELRISAVIDLSEMSLPHQREFVATFIAAVNALPRALWHDCLIVIDEAHLFAPEKGKGESEAREAIAMLLSTGRKRGYCAVLATQRLAKLDKDVAAECLNKLIGRTSSEDAKRAAEELAFDRNGARDLRSQEPGNFWAYGPALSIDPVLVRTGDVATRPPKRGDVREVAPPTPAAIAAVTAELADLPQQEDEEAKSTEGLRRRIRELERQIARGPQPEKQIIEKPVVDQVAVRREVLRALDAQARDISKRNSEAARAGARVVPELERVVTTIGDLVPRIRGMLSTLETPVPVDAGNGNGHGTMSPVTSVAVARPPVSTTRPARVEPETVASEGLSVPQQRILNAIAWFNAIGIEAPKRSAVAAVAGQSNSPEGLKKNISTLSTRGLLLRRESDRLALTAEGESRATSEATTTTVGELHDEILQSVSNPQADILRVLIAHHPRPVPRDILQEESKQLARPEGFKKNLSTLASRDLIERAGGGSFRATEVLFPEGLARKVGR